MDSTGQSSSYLFSKCALIDWGRDKIAAILQTIFSNVFSLFENGLILIVTSLNLAFKDLIDHESTLFKTMKPLSDLMVAYFTDIYIYVSLGLSELMYHNIGEVATIYESLFQAHYSDSHLKVLNEIDLMWLTQILIDYKSTMVQILASCHQASNHYLNQCWRSYMTPYDITIEQFSHDDVNKWKYFPRYWSFVRRISHTKASDAEPWCFLWSVAEQTIV